MIHKCSESVLVNSNLSIKKVACENPLLHQVTRKPSLFYMGERALFLLTNVTRLTG